MNKDKNKNHHHLNIAVHHLPNLHNLPNLHHLHKFLLNHSPNPNPNLNLIKIRVIVQKKRENNDF